MTTDLGPDDVRTQADLANAMEAVRLRARMSYGGIAARSESWTTRISKATAKNITTGEKLPTESSLRAFLWACQVDSAVIDEWCTVLSRIRFDGEVDRSPEPVRAAALITPPEGEAWREFFSLPLFGRIMKSDAAMIFPAVRELVDDAISVLSAEYETGPAYTLHGVRHSVAVVRRLGQLLGADIKRLNAHEAGLLIVGSFFHDVGRVPGLPVEISASHVGRYLSSAGGTAPRWDQDSDAVPAPLVEDYCTWDRTRRLEEYLKRLPRQWFDWDGIPMRDLLGVVCAEQTRPSEKASSLATFPGVDLALCASLLRLATRLELCSLRSAQDIYRRLGIERRSEPRHSAEDIEWSGYVRRLTLVPRRHNADYVFEAEGIILRPVVEFDLRNLLAALREEFLDCHVSRTTWSDTWRKLPLPNTVEIAKLRGIGYTYEKLTFELVRDDVLELLGGTKLYGNPNVFVRELLQNAVDAVRLRRLLDPDHERGAVAVSCWEEGGSIWFRIDDNGIGMDLYAIRKYFLQVGRSYYNSDDLRRELRHLSAQRSRFGAISRFGIGVMSCFMLGDRIEVSTRKFDGRGERGTALRLSVDRREDFATLRREGQGDDPILAGPGVAALDFRATSGTTVAVRIDSAKHYVPPQVLLKHAAYFHFTAECALTLNGNEHVGVDLHKPIIERVTSVKRSLGKARKSEFTARHLGKVTIYAVPLDVTGSSSEPRVQGQLVAIVALPPAVRDQTLLHLLTPVKRSKLHPIIREALAATPVRVEASADLSSVSINCDWKEGTRELLAGLDLDDLPLNEEKRQDAVLQRLRKRFNDEFGDLDVRVMTYLGEGVHFEDEYEGFGLSKAVSRLRWWGHNGITLPVKKRYEYATDDLEEDFDDEIEFDYMKLPSSTTSTGGNVLLVGNIGFTDDLRPDLSLARDELEDIPFAMPAALLLALGRAIPAEVPEEVRNALLEFFRTSRLLESYETVDAGTVLDAVESIEGGWLDEPVLSTNGIEHTITQVVETAAIEPVELEFDKRALGYHRSTFTLVGTSLAQRWLNLRWSFADNSSGDGHIIAVPERNLMPAEVLRFFPPLTFMQYETGAELRVGEGPWNAAHPLCSWLISRGVEIRDRLPAYFDELREIFLRVTDGDFLYYAEEKHKQGLIDMNSIIEEYSVDDYLQDVDDVDEAEVSRVRLALIKVFVDRVIAAAPDLSPPREVTALPDA
ncbi:molecular chaperone [Actinosynnema sp. NPDC023658]|uniref:HD domain-containing protein n=1 Tax=Actinosynnema sp. NPDC023658 TaxID=3155465 RepID=UPI0034101673